MKTTFLTDKNLGFDKNSLFSSLLGLNPYWDYENINENIGRKITGLSTIDIIRLKADCINGCCLNGEKNPLLYSFVLNKPPGYKTFYSPETIIYKKLNKIVLDNINFHLEDNNDNGINLNGKTITFTL